VEPVGIQAGRNKEKGGWRSANAKGMFLLVLLVVCHVSRNSKQGAGLMLYAVRNGE